MSMKFHAFPMAGNAITSQPIQPLVFKAILLIPNNRNYNIATFQLSVKRNISVLIYFFHPLSRQVKAAKAALLSQGYVIGGIVAAIVYISFDIFVSLASQPV